MLLPLDISEEADLSGFIASEIGQTATCGLGIGVGQIDYRTTASYDNTREEKIGSSTNIDLDYAAAQSGWQNSGSL